LILVSSMTNFNFFEAEKLPFKFDIEKLKKYLYENILPLGDPIIQNGAYGPAFGGWAISSNTGHWYDGWAQGDSAIINGVLDFKIAKKVGYVPSFNYTKPTEACVGYINEVIETIDQAGFYPRRVRATVLQPRGRSSKHRDAGPTIYGARIHIPIITSPECIHTIWDDNGKRYNNHLEADGSAYILWVNNMHQIFNFTNTPRYHIIMDAWDTKGITERFKFDHIDTLKSEVEKINNMLNEE
jgi:hypothetical protein